MQIEINETKYTEADVPQCLAIDAMQVQDACNLGGVSKSFSSAVSFLHTHPTYAGTEWIRHHPVVILYVSKISSLTNEDGGPVGMFHQAYELCKSVINSHD